MTLLSPVIGQWYHASLEEEAFEVVAVDDQAETIEIQYFGGDISEIDFESWKQLSLSLVEAPEDACAGYELSQEDTWKNDDAIVPENWSSPLISIEPDIFPEADDY